MFFHHKFPLSPGVLRSGVKSADIRLQSIFFQRSLHAFALISREQLTSVIFNPIEQEYSDYECMRGVSVCKRR